ncbi:DUF2552 domain-containing protein [Bacillus sp. HMF5848]|uniref:DUF2552 family protein n=1 Tax=Bacillus sp. HMF5848 TaxID=2495421 RepID=UPI000F76B7D8|nr:DUF2552 family protein [Bacillus sp. HMF5848]RSK27729.1 DUF2552 domain-containing protein [Bacillus sp. HMF5848]
MKNKIESIKNVARSKTWVSFVNENNEPYSLLHWSVGGVNSDPKDSWLVQDEMTFETREFATLEEATAWIEENVGIILDILG